MKSRESLLVFAGLCCSTLLSGCMGFGSSKPVEVHHETRETRSGVEYVDLRPGTGEPVVHGSTVVVHYVASLLDGEDFDSSYDRGVPEEFVVGANTVIKGWENGLIGMRPGGQRRMVLPPELAYGSEGLADLVPPESTIVLLVDLLENRLP
jgi:peptidylprolyl isomerase